MKFILFIIIIVGFNSNLIAQQNDLYAIVGDTYYVSDGNKISCFTKIGRNPFMDSNIQFRVGFYLSTDEVINTNDYLIGFVNFNTMPNVEQHVFIEDILFSSIQGLPFGEYYFGVFVDDLNQIEEVDELNNKVVARGPKVNYSGVSVGSYVKDDDFKVYKDGFDNLKIEASNGKTATVEIYSLEGKKVYQQHYVSKATVNKSEIGAGVFIVMFRSEERIKLIQKIKL
ncbi:MAG: T9SS type A sorting domain-containing protein [Bacteroidetes bacterium]|nr:T9SS type A sorting domain-containing protein [Bacteroidota bacterium]